MAITRKEKEEILTRLTEDLKASKSVVISEYKGLTVAQLTKVRKMLRNEKVKYQVVKITLLKKALQALGIGGELEFKGPVALALSAEDESTPARVLKAATKQFPALVLDGGIVNNEIIDHAMVERLASLPSKEQLLAQLLSVLQGPARGLVTVLSGNTRNLLNVLNAIKDKRY